VQFTADSHPDVASGRITVTFRLWARPHARVGGRYNVGDVVIEVDSIDLVPFAGITRADLRRSGAGSMEALRARAAHSGPIDDDTLLYRIGFHVVGDRDRAPRTTDAATVTDVLRRLDAMDRRSRVGAWTRPTLRLIGDREGTVSSELAAALDRPRPEFKVDVRKLKALGLTESLTVGYRLTPLGRAVLDASPRARA
jgi:hypothetical protein